MQTKPKLIQAVEALQRFDRDLAVALLNEELRDGPPAGDRWKSAATLAAHIGELEIALECARRYAATPPQDLSKILFYCSELAQAGRMTAALAELAKLSAQHQSNPVILHFLGTCAGERGDFVEAEQLYRRALAATPHLPQTWFALAMIRKFAQGDQDIVTMERLSPDMAKANPVEYARFLYGLAKAYDDVGDTDRAFALYGQGAALRKSASRLDLKATAERADRMIAEYRPENMRSLKPSGCTENRAIFVNGLPRSGTTLVEQILASHSAVADGAELNLMRAALIPAGDFSLTSALAYQDRSRSPDPWGDLGRNYYQKLASRFGPDGLIVDKTLVQSSLMGLLLHTLPDAKVIWLRRNPEDNASSCYKTYFTVANNWTWSLADIGEFYRIEDRLYRHWVDLFPDRILTVGYEELTVDPTTWIGKILAHVGLEQEPQVYRPHETKRSVRTASVQQVRAPISSKRVGSAAAAGHHLDAFRKAYLA